MAGISLDEAKRLWASGSTPQSLYDYLYARDTNCFKSAFVSGKAHLDGLRDATYKVVLSGGSGEFKRELLPAQNAVRHSRLKVDGDAGRDCELPGTRVVLDQLRAYESVGIDRVAFDANDDGRSFWVRRGSVYQCTMGMPARSGGAELARRMSEIDVPEELQSFLEDFAERHMAKEMPLDELCEECEEQLGNEGAVEFYKELFSEPWQGYAEVGALADAMQAAIDEREASRQGE